MRIVIGAAAGNVGRHVAEHVIRAGADTVLLVRNPASLPPSLAAKAQVAVVDLADAAAVGAACRGTEALFWLVPPAPQAPDWEQWYHAVGAAGAAAVRENRIARAVLISSLGAGMAPGLGTVSYTGDTERRFNEAGASVVALRPGYFMENFYWQVESIRRQGLVAFPYAEDHDIPFLSTADIGATAARYLLRPDWAGQWTRNLMGPANLTLPACAAIIADVWGQPVRYQRQSDEALGQRLAQAGLPPPGQQQMRALYRALGDPDGPYATPRPARPKPTRPPPSGTSWRRSCCPGCRPAANPARPSAAAAQGSDKSSNSQKRPAERTFGGPYSKN